MRNTKSDSSTILPKLNISIPPGATEEETTRAEIEEIKKHVHYWTEQAERDSRVTDSVVNASKSGTEPDTDGEIDPRVDANQMASFWNLELKDKRESLGRWRWGAHRYNPDV